MPIRRSSIFCAMGIGILTAAPAVASASTRPLFLSGAPAPTGLSFASFGRAAMNARGTVCFLAGWDSFHDRPEGLYLRRGDQVLPVVRSGDALPDDPASHFSFPYNHPDGFALFSLNSQDQVAFVVRQGLFLYDGGVIKPIARVGTPVPGTSDEVWDEVYSVSLNSSGVIAFAATAHSTADGQPEEGVFLASGGTVQISVFEGDPVTGLDGQIDGVDAVALNDAGQIATLAEVGDDGLGAVLRTTGSQTSAVAVEGQSAPGGTWSQLNGVAINGGGDIAFSGQVSGTSGTESGIFLAAHGAVSSVAMQGQPLDAAGQFKLSAVLNRPVLDDAGNVAFLGGIDGSNGRRALILASGGRLSALATEGQTVPAGLVGVIDQFSGLNLGSLGPGGVVCGVSMNNGPATDAVVRFPLAGTPEMLASTATPLPPGGAVMLDDDDTSPQEVQAARNARGDVVFAAEVGGYGRALFQVGDQGPVLLTPLGGRAAPGPALRSVTAFSLNGAGQIAFLAEGDEIGQEQTLNSIDLSGNNTVIRIIAAGQAVTTAPGRSIVQLGAPVIDLNGRVVFSAVGSDSQGETASYLLRASNAGLEQLAAAGQPVEGGGELASNPDADPGSAPDLFLDLQVDSSGAALFLSGYQDGKTGSFISSGLFTLSDGKVQPVALPGQKAPTSSTAWYTGFAAPRWGAAGAVTFVGTVIGASHRSQSVLLQLAAGGATILAGTGDVIPGTGGAHVLSLSSPAISPSGDLAFFAALDQISAAGGNGVLVIDNNTSQIALSDGDPLGGVTDASFQLDDQFPVGALSYGEDGLILIAAHLRTGPAANGLFLLTPP